VFDVANVASSVEASNKVSEKTTVGLLYCSFSCWQCLFCCQVGSSKRFGRNEVNVTKR